MEFCQNLSSSYKPQGLFFSWLKQLCHENTSRVVDTIKLYQIDRCAKVVSALKKLNFVFDLNGQHMFARQDDHVELLLKAVLIREFVG